MGVRAFSGWARRLGDEFQAGWIREQGPDYPIPGLPGYSNENRTRLLSGNLAYHFRADGSAQPFVFAGFGHRGAV